MQLNILFQLAVLLLCGLLFAKLIRLIKLPDVTGYLVGGLVIGPSVLGLLSSEAVANLSIISTIALGFIAFSIGSEFKISYFRRVGITPVIIALCESFFAVGFVVLGLIILGQPLSFALILGAIAAATAPAATIMVIRQYRAKGPVTDMLLSVVAIDDATALIAFGICVAIAGTLNNTAGGLLPWDMIKPVLEIAAALAIGLILGSFLTGLVQFFKQSSNRMILCIAFVFVASVTADRLNLSALLMTMAMGAAFCNLCKNSVDIIGLCDHITPPIFMMFFVLSGAGLNLSILPAVGLAGSVYIVLRVCGKLAGAWVGASLMHTEPKIRKWLGPALLPQAGVAIGLTVVAQSAVPHYAEQIRTIILCATLIYELLGPGISRWTLKKAGEITL